MTLELKIPNLACDACVKTVTNTILSLDSQASIKADSKTKQLVIETEVSESSVKEALTSAGYPPA